MTKLLTATAALLLAAGPAVAEHCTKSCESHPTTVYHAVPVTTVSHHATAEAAKDIVDTAASIDDFSTLVAAVKAAGLVEALKGDGPFTVFAPTNEAFAKLPEGTVETLLKPENKQQLTNILLYHVVPAKVLAKDVVNVESAPTLLAESEDKPRTVAVKVDGGKVFINDAQVIKTDVETKNGVIHVVDSVILP